MFFEDFQLHSISFKVLFLRLTLIPFAFVFIGKQSANNFYKTVVDIIYLFVIMFVMVNISNGIAFRLRFCFCV